MEDYHHRSGQPLRRPLLVIVSGAPGSGKTTIAGRIAAEMRLPHLNRDLIRDGLWMTDGDDASVTTDRAWVVWMSAVQLCLREGVSMVIDQTFYRGRSDVTVRNELVPSAWAVNVHLRADDAIQRFQARMAGDVRAGDMNALMARVHEIQPLVREPLDFGCPVVEVDTTPTEIPIEPITAQVWHHAHALDRSTAAVGHAEPRPHS